MKKEIQGQVPSEFIQPNLTDSGRLGNEELGLTVPSEEKSRSITKEEKFYPYAYSVPPNPSLPVEIGDYFKKDYSYAWALCQKRDRTHRQSSLVIRQLAMMLRQHMPKEEEKEARAWKNHFLTAHVPVAYRVTLEEWQGFLADLKAELGTDSDHAQRFEAALIQAGFEEDLLKQSISWPLEISEDTRQNRLTHFASFKKLALETKEVTSVTSGEKNQVRASSVEAVEIKKTKLTKGPK